jgi:hypothetical protein
MVDPAQDKGPAFAKKGRASEKADEPELAEHDVAVVRARTVGINGTAAGVARLQPQVGALGLDPHAPAGMAPRFRPAEPEYWPTSAAVSDPFSTSSP